MSEPNYNPPHPGDEPLTPYQEAIRARAIATLENEARQPQPTTRRKIYTAVAALVTVLLLGFGIDFGVRIIQRILSLYGQEESAPAPVPTGPDQPYFITVDPPAGEASSAVSAETSAE